MSGVVIVETLRRHFISPAYLAALGGLVFIEAFMGLHGAPHVMTNLFVLTFVVIAGCQIIGPEFSSGMLQLIMSKPMQRSRYLLSRVAGVVLALWFLVLAMYGANVAGRASGGYVVDWISGSGMAAADAARAVLMCSLLALFGSFTRSYINAAILLLGELVLKAMHFAVETLEEETNGVFAPLGRYLREHLPLRRALEIAIDNVYPRLPSTAYDHKWLLMVFCSAAVALLLACLVFRKREVPYGAD